MDPSGSNVFRQSIQQPVIQLKLYQGYSVSTLPLGTPPPGFPPLRRAVPIPIQPEQPPEQPEIIEEEEDRSDCETVDLELEKMLSKPPPAPVPCQIDKFNHMLKVGFFVATIEALSDRGYEDVETIRKNALEKEQELIRSVGEEDVPPVDPNRPLCGSARINRDLKRMAMHVPFFNDLLNKFVEEFDGSPLRVTKLRQVTGYIKGIMARDGYPVFNITDKQNRSEFSALLDIFKVNAILFLEYLKGFKTTPSQ